MFIPIRYFKFILVILGIVLLLTGLFDKDWSLSGLGALTAAFGWLFGYGVERLFLYIKHHPGGTQLSKFLTGR